MIILIRQRTPYNPYVSSKEANLLVTNKDGEIIGRVSRTNNVLLSEGDFEIDLIIEEKKDDRKNDGGN